MNQVKVKEEYGVGRINKSKKKVQTMEHETESISKSKKRA